jgi:hypothetical protein
LAGAIIVHARGILEINRWLNDQLTVSRLNHIRSYQLRMWFLKVICHAVGLINDIIFTGLAFFGQDAGHDLSAALMAPETIQLLQFGLIGLGFAGSLYTAYRIAKANYPQEKLWGTFAPYAVLIVVLGAITVWMFVLPMAMRM